MGFLLFFGLLYLTYGIGWVFGFLTATVIYKQPKQVTAPVRTTVRDLNPNKYNQDN